MNKVRAQEIKNELRDCLDNKDYGCLSEESISQILSMMERIYPNTIDIKDTTPMIGSNPFKKSNTNISDQEKSTKDFNKSLNYRVNRFDENS